MAIEVGIPVEIEDYHEKILGGMTARQLIGLGCAVVLGAGSYFLSLKVLNLPLSTSGYFVMLCAALPLAIGFIRIDGQPCEKYLTLILRHMTGQHRFNLEIEAGGESYEYRAEHTGKCRRDRRKPAVEYIDLSTDKKAEARRRKAAKKSVKAAQAEYHATKRSRKKQDKEGGSAEEYGAASEL